MDKQPMFSIIVPVYKVEKYLTQCVDSLLAQDYSDYEVILVDDGSPDNCPSICDSYAAANDKVIALHKINGGLSDARNFGMKRARGRYITFVDSDDFWKNIDVLSGIATLIDSNNEPDVVVSDFYKYYEATDRYVQPLMISPGSLNGLSKIDVLKHLYFCQADMKMSACQKFAKGELLTGLTFEKGLLSEDIDWSLKLYTRVESICAYPKPFYCYRQQREGSITNTASRRSFDSLMFIIDKWAIKIPNLNIPEEEKQIYLGYLAYQLSIALSVYNNLTKEEKHVAINQLRSYKGLFSCKLNSKTMKVKVLVDILGMANTSKLLKLFLFTRQFRQKY